MYVILDVVGIYFTLAIFINFFYWIDPYQLLTFSNHLCPLATCP